MPSSCCPCRLLLFGFPDLMPISCMYIIYISHTHTLTNTLKLKRRMCTT
uniref:Uncharacterized protein n=1 Tax=Anguilla anguilla TaxID=7936 RepID=A0A0E9XKE9_ANGAN